MPENTSSAKLRGLLMLSNASTAPEAPQPADDIRSRLVPLPAPNLSVMPVTAALSPSQDTLADQLAYFYRPSGIPFVRHSPLPLTAQAVAGSIAKAVSQTEAGRAIAASLPGIRRQNGPVTALSSAVNQATLDVVPDGVSFGRVATSELINNGVKQLNDGVNVRTAASVAAAHDAVGNLLFKNVANAVGTTNNPTTTSGTYVTMPEMSVAVTTKGNRVLLAFTGTIQYTSTSTQASVAFFRDGVQVSKDIVWVPFGTTGLVIAVTYIDSPSSGSHTFDLRWHGDSISTLTASATLRQMQVVELG